MCFFRKKKKEKLNKVEEKKVEKQDEKVVDLKEEQPKTTKTLATKSSTVKTAKTKTVAPKTTKTPAKTTAKTMTKAEPKEEPKSKKPIYRVVYDKDARLWLIKKDGAKRTIASYTTKEEALNRVKELSNSKELSFVVHKKYGKFQKK